MAPTLQADSLPLAPPGKPKMCLQQDKCGSPVAQRWNLPASAGDGRDSGSIPGLGRSPGGGNGNLLQYYCLENPMDRGPWWTTAGSHRVTRSRTRLTELPNKVLGDWVLPSRHLRASVAGLRSEGRLQRPRCHTGTSVALTPVLVCPEVVRVTWGPRTEVSL